MIGVESLEELQTLRREFGRKLKQFLIQMRAESLEEAQEIVQRAGG